VQAEEARKLEAFREDDEPLFAIQPTAEAEAAPENAASVAAPEAVSRKKQPKKSEQELAEDKAVRTRLREILAELVADYASEERGMEIRQIAGGFRMATKPQHHDVVRAFAKSLKPAIRLSLAALETLAVIAYKQPVTAPEIADIRGVESASVLGTLLDRKLITTAGRKQVIGRPMQYKTSKDFLLRFGLNDVNELPSMEEFSQLASEATIEIAPVEQTPSLFEPDAPADGSEALPDTPDRRDHEAPSPGPQAQEADRPAAAQASTTQPQPDSEPGTSSETSSDSGNPLD
jgi:segregation and condensation protein B